MSASAATRSSRALAAARSGAVAVALPMGILVVLLAIVELVIRGWGGITGDPLPAAQFPLPSRVLESFATNFSTIAEAARPTVESSLIGFGVGVAIGVALAMLLWWSRILDAAVGPFVAVIPMIPVIAVAPLLGVMVTDPRTARILLAAWVTCFPIIVNTAKGLRSTDRGAEELAQTYAMPRWLYLRKIVFPSALPHIFAGARVGATWAVIGSIVLEFTGNGAGGLGLLMLRLSYFGEGVQADGTDGAAYFLWAAALGAAVVGLLLYALVALVERIALRGRPVQEL